MKVIVKTYARDKNPYLRLLVSSLEAAGLHVCVARSGRFFLWRAVIKHGRPDVIHLQWQHTTFGGSLLLLAVLRTALFYLQWFTLRLLGVRFVWTVHNVINHEKEHATWELLACRIWARMVDGIIVHCQAAVSTVATAYKIDAKRVSVVPHGHYADCYPPALTKQQARNELNLSTKDRLFLFFGQVRSYKGLDRLLTAFAKLNAENVRLILLGDPKPASLGHSLSVQATADSRVVIDFGFVPDDRLIVYLSACDLVVLPYRDSLTSGAAILAASYNRPLLMPKLGCMGQFPPDTALLYDPDLPNGIEDALKQALVTPLDEMGFSAKRHVEQFPWSLVATRTIDVYRSALGTRHATEALSSSVDI